MRLKLEQGPYLSFVPETPGRYQFALVVAAGSAISAPASVTVNVEPDPRGGAQVSAPPALEDEVRASVMGLPEGPAQAGALAGVFDRVAQRMTLYSTYAEAFQEMSRQLDAIVPADAVRRRAWIDGLFQPLTLRVVESLRGDGLDLRLPDGQAAPLTASQKTRLTTLFRTMADGARSAGRLSAR